LTGFRRLVTSIVPLQFIASPRPVGVVIPTLFLLTDESPDLSEPWRPEPVPEPEPSPAPLARRRVLVAEDDPMVRGVIERLLAEEGYEVRTARHGDDALRLALRGSGAFDLVVTDVRMPVMDGWELGRRLRERWPRLPVLYISGYDVELTHGGPRSGQPEAFLRKPFDADELVRHVASLLQNC
jgi:two-component system cell cycle sensor histidine kinase/response regulator CckA